MSNVALVVHFDIKDEYRVEFEKIIRAHAKLTLQNEEGCLQFDVLIPKDGSRHIHLYEVYRDEEAYQKHTKAKSLVDLRERYKNMLNSRDIVVCER